MSDTKHSAAKPPQVANPAAGPPNKAAPKKAPEKKTPAPAKENKAEPEVNPNSTLALFGKSDKPFSMDTAKQLFTQGEAEFVQYLRRFFAKTDSPIGFAMHKPKSPVKLFKSSDLSHFVGGKSAKVTRIDAEGNVQKLVPNNVVNGFELVSVAVDPTKPPVYDADGQTTINLFGGWLHPHLTGDAAKPTPAELKMIEPFLNHIREVWCPKDKVMYDFIIRWFARIAQMGKNQIGLFLKATQGVGKSIIFDMMIKLVFGPNATLSTDKASIITGDFNSALQGISLLVLEEMPTVTAGQYQELTNRLKLICTGATLQTMKKYADEMTVKNTISVAVLSNRDALALEATDRRWAELDLSDHKRGDMKYFEKIGFSSWPEAKQKALGLAMWKYLLCVDIKGHLDNVAPPTRAKAAHTMPLIGAFIKDVILSKAGLHLEKQKFSQFYDSFALWHKEKYPKALKVPDKKTVSQQLKMIDCIVSKEMRFNGSNPMTGILRTTRGQLILEFDSKMWVDRTIDDVERVNADGSPAAAAAADPDDDDAAPAVPLVVAPPKAKWVKRVPANVDDLF